VNIWSKMPRFVAGLRLIRGLSVQFVGIPANVTFASHVFRLNVARARFCFNFCRAREIQVLAAIRPRARPWHPDRSVSAELERGLSVLTSSGCGREISWRRVRPGEAI
ncbi:hypothetical protein, partial [Mesorhizobium sp. M7A.T.Ca.US.000.02.2.1]|uniref:hypothetical protein n=1 Tax=Mesorhizobium sp. M7A.T.Ca.US.000.02.2.1 TaxID=2496793 RepID=UPI001AECD60F